MARVAMIVSNRYDPDPRVEKEARSLALGGHDVTVYAFDRYREMALAEEERDGIRIERIQPPVPMPRNMVGTRLGLLHFVREVRRRLLRTRPLIVHCHDQDTCALGLWWKEHGAARAGLPVGRFVFDAHDLYWTWALLPNPAARWRAALAAALRYRDRQYARAADLLITVTEAWGGHAGTAEIYREWGCDPVVIWNAPDAPHSAPKMPEHFCVGYLGNVREPAMFRDLLKALHLLKADERPAVRIAGLGRSADEVRRMFESEAPALGIDVRITGGFSMAELPGLIADCSVQYCVYPMQRGNIDRAMPVKLLESVAYGRRVIGNADTMMGDAITANAWGWTVKEGDPDALASVLRLARSTCIRDAGVLPTLRPPPLWPEQGLRLVGAYERLLS